MNRRAQALIAAGVVAIVSACSHLPWQEERPNENNVSFDFRQNLPVIDASIGGRAIRLIVGTATPVTLLSPELMRNGPTSVLLRGDVTLQIRPEVLQVPLGTVADGILGADALEKNVVTIDYAKRLLILGSQRSQPTDMAHFAYSGAPRVPVVIDGDEMPALIDTASPDTITIPGPRDERLQTTVVIAETTMTESVRVMPGATARIGNRLLARFLVRIDYPRQRVSVWHDPRPSVGRITTP